MAILTFNNKEKLDLVKVQKNTKFYPFSGRCGPGAGSIPGAHPLWLCKMSTGIYKEKQEQIILLDLDPYQKFYIESPYKTESNPT